MAKLPDYVVVTPARDEAQFIELTIQSLLAQTVLPLKWVIVSDGSLDGTDDIVKKYAAQHSWMELLRMPERRERDFAGKVRAFNAGLARVHNLPFEVIVSLDGDVTFDADYFAYLLEKLAGNAKLGLVGTPFQETTGESYDYRFVNIEHVSGVCQVFRRDCFESIGRYVASKGGGIDSIAAVSARMKDWKTRTFTGKVCTHHRKMGTAQGGVVKARFKFGAKDYAIGNHPVWELCRCVHQMTTRPFLVGGLALGLGYLSACARHPDRYVSREFIAFRRKEQMSRLALFVRGRFLRDPAHEAGRTLHRRAEKSPGAESS